MAEMIDVYNSERIRTGKILHRQNIFSKLEKDEYVFLVHVCIFNRYGEMLIQHRVKEKNKYPDMWDISAGGFVQSGEDTKLSACRELEEELGISSDECDIAFICCEPFNCVFDDIYIGYADKPSSEFDFQKEELSEVKWADCDTILNMISSGKFVDYSPELIKFAFNSFRAKNFNVLKNPCSCRHSDISQFGLESAEKAVEFHKTLDGYCETPLADLSPQFADDNTGSVYIKDESKRFGLNAFKSLGGSYAAYCMLDTLKKDSFLITATDGNHGRGIAWAAKALNLKCKVYLPRGTAKERVDNISSLGAEAVVLDLLYDDCVRKAKDDANKYGYVLIQDTAWDGYEDIPSNIMKGYLTMALEAVNKLGDKIPTHVFLQAGVGSMAGALTAFFTDYYKDDKPKIIIVEPNTADCVYETAKCNDGKLHAATGNLDTIMAGLSCGEVSSVAWPILRDYADYFITITDSVASNGMRELNKISFISGESGCAGFAAFQEIVKNPLLSTYRDEIGLNESSVVLCFSTEGATDMTGYSRVINGEI